MKLFSVSEKSIYGLLTYILNFSIGLLTVNTYAPLTEGWWHVYARWIDQGRVPYRDFELLVTPGFPYITWFFKHLVGEEFLHLRLIGLIFQAGIALLLFLILSKHVSKLTSAGLATLGTTLLYSGTASISFDYNYFAVFFAVLSIYFLQKDSLEEKNWPFFAGISIAAVFLIKQSTGLSLFLFVFLIPFLDKSFLKCEKLRIWLKIFLGFFVPLALVSIMFIIIGAFTPMIKQVFVQSTNVKGGTASILTNWIEGIYEPFSFGYAIRHVLFLTLLVLFLQWLAKQKHLHFNFNKFILFVTVIVGLLTAIETIRSRFYSSDNTLRNFLENIDTKISPYIYLEPLLIMLFLLYWTQRKYRYEWLPILMLALAMTCSTGMSAGLTEYGIFMNIVVSLAWLNQYLNFRFLNYLFLIVSLLFSSSQILNKYETPYSWWGYATPSIYFSTFPSTNGLTRGLKFSERSYKEFREISENLSLLSCKGEVIGYPHMPIFALDSNRLPTGRVAIYWFDFISVEGLKTEKNRFLNGSISAVIEMNLPNVASAHSNLYGSHGLLYREQLEASLFQNRKHLKHKTFSSLKLSLASCGEINDA